MRLQLNSEGRYGLRALIYLAQISARATAGMISTEAHIPRRQLARVLAKLSHAGLVESHEGRGGGTRLARPSEEITLRDAVEAAEGSFEMTHCIMQQRTCGEGKPCMMHQAWEQGQETILGYLEEQVLSDFVSQSLPPQH